MGGMPAVDHRRRASPSSPSAARTAAHAVPWSRPQSWAPTLVGALLGSLADGIMTGPGVTRGSHAEFYTFLADLYNVVVFIVDEAFTSQVRCVTARARCDAALQGSALVADRARLSPITPPTPARAH